MKQRKEIEEMILNHKQVDFLLQNEGVFKAFFENLAFKGNNNLISWKGKESSGIDTLVLKKGNSKFIEDKKTKFWKKKNNNSTIEE